MTDWSTFIGRAHLVGICGSGMKALAEWMLDCGWTVSGSDLQGDSIAADSLRKRGAPVGHGHQAEHLPPTLDLLVHSAAIPAQNPERHAAALRGVPQLAYHQFLGELQRQRTGVCVAGTHGKSTTTAMTGTLFSVAGLAPSVFCGAELVERGVNGWAGNGPHVIVESCEYRRHFLELFPQSAVILGIEEDHFDCFESLSATVAAFQEFAQRVPATGVLVVPYEQRALLLENTPIQALIQTFGTDPQADWSYADVRVDGAGTQFRLRQRHGWEREISLRVAGQHHAANATAAAALGHSAGISPDDIQHGLSQYAGLRRRLEITHCDRGITLIEDYAHHPTAIRATLQTVREVFSGRRIWCVFQPHQVSRTKGLFAEFATSFAAADVVWITEIFGARESGGRELTEVAQHLADAIEAHGIRSHFSGSLDQTFATMDDAALPGDVIITLGAGDIDRIHYACTRRLSGHHS